jgi:hypothetical protein
LCPNRGVLVSDQDKSGADSIGTGLVRLVFEVSRLLRPYLLGLEFHAADVDRHRALVEPGYCMKTILPPVSVFISCSK